MATKTKTKLKPLELRLRIPHVCIDVRGADPALLQALEPGLEELGARFKVLGTGLLSIPQVFSLEEAMEEAHLWLVLGPKLPKEFSMIVERGIVPVMLDHLHPQAQNYNPVKEDGNAFLFPKAVSWQVYGALVRAIENFAFSYDWETVRREGRCMM